MRIKIYYNKPSIGIHGIQHHVREWLFFKYPCLPAQDVEKSIGYYVNQNTLNAFAKKYAVFTAISYFVSSNFYKYIFTDASHLQVIF
jgi:dsRNA-specific ribonuclease